MFLASLVMGKSSASADSNGDAPKYPNDRLYFSSGVTLFSPINRTYNSRFLTLNFSFALGWGMRYSLYYDIDGKYGGPMPYVIKNPEELHVIYHSTGLVKLPELSEGLHSLTVCLETGVSNNHIKPLYVDTVNFAIDTTPQSIVLLSPENKTYTTTDIPLDFTINEQASKTSYCLDGGNDTAIDGNTTLTALSLGAHNLTVSAVDKAGHVGTSRTAYFNIINETQTAPQPLKPQPTTIAAAFSASAAAAGFGLGVIVYLKKHKHKEQQPD